MHIHGAQMNSVSDLYAAYAAQKAQARLEAEATKKKLLESASRLASYREDYIVKLDGRQGSGGGQRKQSGQQGGSEQKEDKREDGASEVSEWA